jgi:hypothetical protein
LCLHRELPDKARQHLFHGDDLLDESPMNLRCIERSALRMLWLSSSHAEPIAACRKRLASASLPRPQLSAIFEQIETAARLI